MSSLSAILLLFLAVCLSLLWLFVVLVLSVLFHELCHALAAWVFGYIVTSFGIGSGRPLFRVRLPRCGTLFYICRFGLRFSGVTWVFHPAGTPRRRADLLLACAGASGNALLAIGAAFLLSSFLPLSVPFLTVWVPIVVVLLVNSVLALLFFLPHRIVSAEQGALTSDGLQALSLLFPSRFRNRRSGSASAGALRTLAEKRIFWESIDDTTMLCVALLRAAEASEELGDRETAHAYWREASDLPVMPVAAWYQQAWICLLAVRLGLVGNREESLTEAESLFTEGGSETGKVLVAREKLLHADPRNSAEAESAREALQSASIGLRDVAITLTLLADRIEREAQLLLQVKRSVSGESANGALIESLASQYDAARRGGEPSLSDIRAYSAIAAVRSTIGDDGGAAIAYERALSALRRTFLSLAFDSTLQETFARQNQPLVTEACQCFQRLGRDAEADRCRFLLK